MFGAIESYCSEVGETLSDHDLGYTQPICVEGSDDGGIGVVIFNSFANNSWINKRNYTTEGCSGWQSGIRADRGDIDNKWVEVLLGRDESTSSGNSSVAGSKLGHNLIGLSEFCV